MERNCDACGVTFTYDETKRGRPALFCLEHRSTKGAPRDPEGIKTRAAAMQRVRRAAARQPEPDLRFAQDLACGLAIYPDDPTIAAEYAGIPQRGPDLQRLVEIARKYCQGVIDSDVADMGKRLISSLNFLSFGMVRSRDMLAPRDMPHVARALAQVHEIIVGQQKQVRWSQVALYVVDSDGKPFDIAAASDKRAA